MDPLTIDQFKQTLPDKFKKSVNQQLVDQINTTLTEPEMYEQYRENLVGYMSVLNDGRFTIPNYINAVKYVSYKVMGKTNTDSYSLTFPDKIIRFAKQGVVQKDVASYITAFNKSKLVNLILEQSLIPSWVLNQDLYQKALNTQAELMTYAKSEKVRSDAANSILTHLKQPETQKVELDLGAKADSSIGQLREATLALVAQQRDALRAGTLDAQQVAHSVITVEGEVISDA